MQNVYSFASYTLSAAKMLYLPASPLLTDVQMHLQQGVGKTILKEKTVCVVVAMSVLGRWGW